MFFLLQFFGHQNMPGLDSLEMLDSDPDSMNPDPNS